MENFLIQLKHIHTEMSSLLQEGIVPFWMTRGIDTQFGGYLTSLDVNGLPTGYTEKSIVIQTRMIWGLSAFGGYYHNERILAAATQGVDFFIRYFWDNVHKGWFWKTAHNGQVIDSGKLVYGQSFAIYALVEHFRNTGDLRSMHYAEETFDLLQKYCTDTLYGGYYENLECDWSRAPGGFSAGDRKSLDIHMHVMEAFTLLAQCSGKEIHYRKLEEVIDLILQQMISATSGCGLNQFDRQFQPLLPIHIKRTWNAERQAVQTIQPQVDSTSYGHNLELAWLFNKAGAVLGKPANYFDEVNRKLIDHALGYGFDHEKGGVYRDGPHDGPALVNDKEFWQNAEALAGLLDGYQQFNERKYVEAFIRQWSFVKDFMIHPQLGEFYQMVDRDGNVLVGDMGNPWKACYHSGRAVLECIARIERILQEQDVSSDNVM